MTFMALLTKELRLRLRRERTIWLMIIYILILGLAGWFVVSRVSMQNADITSLAAIGQTLYYLLSLLQLLLIVFITPAFTATAVNGEKERQTFDLLMCSRLSGFSLVTGKLVGGLANAMLLVISSIPLFSLLFLFGGISPLRLLGVLLIYVVTAILVGTYGLLFSVLFRRPALSTAIAYICNILWMVSPLILLFGWWLFTGRSPSNNYASFVVQWNPVAAIVSLDPEYTSGITFSKNGFLLTPWVSYIVVSLLISGLILLICTNVARPRGARIWRRIHKDRVNKAQALA